MSDIKILLAEDDKLLASTIKKGLEYEGFDVDVYYDGFNALNAALERDYTLVILDIVLPKLDGIKVCKNLRGKKEVPIIMLTAKSQVEDKLEGFEAGADDYITKPFSFEELIARIKALLRRYGSKEENRLIEIGDIKIDTATYRVYKNDKLIELTPKEFELLLFMAKNKDRVLHRDILLNKVWGVGVDIDSNIVDVYIKNIRTKLEDKPPKLIQTVRGYGYMLSSGS